MDKRKKDVLVQWLACYEIKIGSLSDLHGGLQLLKLLSNIDPDCSTENIDPACAFLRIEKILCDVHACLPAQFLSTIGARKRAPCSDLDWAVVAVLSLSALVLQATQCGASSSSMDALLQLDQSTQCLIKDMIEIVTAGEDIPANLVDYLQGSPERSPSSGSFQGKRKLDQSFVLSPTKFQSPFKRPSISPQQRALMPVIQAKEVKMLRQHIVDEEESNEQLRLEINKLREAIKKKDKKIDSLNERINALKSVSSDEASSVQKLNEQIEELVSQNGFLKDQVRCLERVREDYDAAIRHNASLKDEMEEMTKLCTEHGALKGKLDAALSEKSELSSKLSSSEKRAATLEAELEAKTTELESLFEFYSDRENRIPSFLASPKTPGTPQVPRVSCYIELQMVELQETNEKLRQQTSQLQSELDEVADRLQSERSALQATISELEKTKASLTAEISGLNLHCSQVNSHVASLQEQLQSSEATAGKMQWQVGILEAESQKLRQQVTDRDQEISALGENFAACRASNDQLLKSNSELDAALKSSEAERAVLAEGLQQAANESRKCQEVISEQCVKIAALDTKVNDLEEKLAEAIQNRESLSLQLSAAKDANISLEQNIAALQSKLAESHATCTELENELSQVRNEKEFQLKQCEQLRGELVASKAATERAQEQVQELEESEHHLEASCSELRLKLSDKECELKAAAEKISTLEMVNKEMQEGHSALRVQLEQAAEEHAVTTASLQQQVEGCRGLVISLQKEKDDVVQKAGRLEGEVESLHSEMAKLCEKNVQLKSQLSEVSQSYEALGRKFSSQSKQVESQVQECARLQQCIEEGSTEREALEARLLQSAEALHKLEEKHAAQASVCENLSDENAKLEKTVEEARIKEHHLEACIEEATKNNTVLQSTIDKSKKELEVVAFDKQGVELRLSEKTVFCSVLEEKLSSLSSTLRNLEERERALTQANASLNSFAEDCKQKLRAGQCQLDEATKQVEFMKHEVHVLQEAITRLNLEKQVLHSSLGAAEAASQSLQEKLQAASDGLDDARRTLEESERKKRELSSLAGQLREECASLKTVLADMSDKLSSHEKELGSLKATLADAHDELASRECELASIRSEAVNLTELVEQLQTEQGSLKHENQALEDRIGDLEVQLHHQQELQKKAEEDYYLCVKERDDQKESLGKQIDELAARASDREAVALENERLQGEVHGLTQMVEDLREGTAAEIARLREEKERVESDLKTELRKTSAQCNELHIRCKILENKNEGLKYELKTSKEGARRKVQAAFVDLNAEVNEKVALLKQSEAALKAEVETWTEKYNSEKGLRIRRETLLAKHMAEMKEHVEQTNKDITLLKAQLAEQSTQLTDRTTERDRLAAENRSLRAQVSFCDAKLREQKKPERSSRVLKASASISSARSVESLPSAHLASAGLSRQSLSSIDSDQFKVPDRRGIPRREDSGASRTGSYVQAAALDSSIFSESRFSCDEEQDVFLETTLADFSTRLEDPLGRFNELSRRNTLAPMHLRSVYPVESTVPTTPLTKGAAFSFSHPAADENKRKRTTQSSSSEETSGSCQRAGVTTTPKNSKKQQKTGRTPSSVKKFLKSTFKR